MRSGRGLATAALLLLSWLAVGCASAPVVAPGVTGSAGFQHLHVDELGQRDRLWPAAPEPARYRFVGQLTGEDNFPRPHASLTRRFFRWLVGLGSRRLQRVELQRPQGIYGDGAGRLYVTDVSRGAVYVFDDAQGRLQVWEMAAARTRFDTPIAITGLADGSLLVTDSKLGKVVRLSHDGVPQGYFADGELERPTGIARDAQRGRIYIADSRRHHIKVFDEQGQWLQTLGSPGDGAGQLNTPTHLHVGHDGSLYVSDTLNARIQVFSAAGRPLQTVGRRGLFVGDMPRPKGVATDSHGHVYVLESYYDYLLVFDADGKFLLPIGGTGSGVGEFYLPAGMWIDDNTDRIFIVDGFNGRVVILQYLGQA
ncbi:MAG: 6-bladed beta-propeller [Gammaproteobacteria bacterium]|nr:6-bladed beta-propeller [Gammaproteobacteria bacterium]